MKSLVLLPFVLASVMGGLLPAAVAPVAYSNVNLNIPAPVPAGEAPAPDVLVQRTAVKALGRPVITHTPVITEVRPELKITEKVYDVAVPKPVYQTKEVTPVQYKHVAEPYAVPQPYPVPQPYAVPVPVAKPVHVHHNVVAAPTTYGAVGYTGAHALGYSGAHLGLGLGYGSLGYGYGNLGYGNLGLGYGYGN